jgi:hypothetical protein
VPVNGQRCDARWGWGVVDVLEELLLLDVDEVEPSA